MTTIVTRAGKGSPLTNNEMDQNLTNLNNDKIETSAIGVTVQAYDVDTAKLDVAQTWTATQTFGTVNTTAVTGDGSGLTNLTTPVKDVQIQLGTAVASTSGTTIDFTGIPSWAKRITVMFSGVSTSGTSNPMVQIGDSGGIETTGYAASSCAAVSGSVSVGATYTTGYGISSNVAAAAIVGALILHKVTGNTWIASHSIGFTSANNTGVSGGGTKTLTGTLDRIRVTTVNGTDTFDAGTVNISWE